MRVLVIIFTLLLIGISVYQLSFTWFVNKHEKELQTKADSYIKRTYQTAAQKYPGNKEQQALYQDSLNEFRKNYLDSLINANREKIHHLVGSQLSKSKRKRIIAGSRLAGRY